MENSDHKDINGKETNRQSSTLCTEVQVENTKIKAYGKSVG